MKKLYFINLDNLYVIKETIFLNYMQLLETYCGLNPEEYYISNNLYQPIFDLMINNIPDIVNDDFFDNVVDRLKYANVHTLKIKLKNIIGEYNQLFEKPILNSREKSSFLFKSVNTRNYLTHYERNLNGVIPSNNPKFKEYINILRLLSEISIMELIFDENIIKQLISHRYYNSTKKEWFSPE